MILFHLILFWISCCISLGFIWDIEDSLPVGYPLKIYEGAMFETNHGPPLHEKGTSYIELDATMTS